MRNPYRRKYLTRLAERICLITVCAFFIWAGTKLLLDDGKNQQMIEFQISNEAFRRLSIGEVRLEKLKQISEKTHLPVEKLLAVSFLRSYFYEASCETAVTLITELAAYERRNPAAFHRISHLYKTMISPVNVFPLPNIKTEGNESEPSWQSVCFDANTWKICFSIDAKWAEILPVFNMENGTVYDVNEKEKTIHIKGENGILYAFGQLETGEMSWKSGDEIFAGALLGRIGGCEKEEKTVKLYLQFLLSSENEEWLPYNGMWSVLNKDCVHYTVRQKLP